jgi:endonuclease/exonuclease/phosphatase family metal-dependent hydrolase
MSVPFTLMTWNVENLFRPGSGGSSGPRDQGTYEAKLAYLTSVIGGVRPDVITLQEVGGVDALEDLRARVADTTAFSFGHVAVSKHPDARGIRVALLSRAPLHDVRQIVDFPPLGLDRVPDVDGGFLTRLGRGALQATVRLDGAGSGHEIRVLTTHLKSKLLTFPNGRRFPEDEDERARGVGFALMRRTGEAVALRVHLNAAMTAEPTVPTVLAGDLNDEAEAVTTGLLSGPEDGDVQRPDQGDQVRLYNLADRLPPARRYSRLFRKRRELIDHLLISRELVFDLRQVDSLVEGLESIDESVRSRRDAVVPDHAPLFARFDLP